MKHGKVTMEKSEAIMIAEKIITDQSVPIYFYVDTTISLEPLFVFEGESYFLAYYNRDIFLGNSLGFAGEPIASFYFTQDIWNKLFGKEDEEIKIFRERVVRMCVKEKARQDKERIEQFVNRWASKETAFDLKVVST